MTECQHEYYFVAKLHDMKSSVLEWTCWKCGKIE